MALEREVQARGMDAANLAATQQSATSLVTPAASALTLLSQMASRLSGYAAQLTALATSGLNDQTSGPANSTAYTTWQGAQQGLTTLVPAEQTWSSIGGLSAARLSSLQQQWQLLRSVSPPTDVAGFGDRALSLLNAYASSATDATLRSTLGVQMPSPPIPPLPPVQPTAGSYTTQTIQFLNMLASTYTNLAASANATVARLSSSNVWSDVVAAVQAAAPPRNNVARPRSRSPRRLAAAACRPIRQRWPHCSRNWPICAQVPGQQESTPAPAACIRTAWWSLTRR